MIIYLRIQKKANEFDLFKNIFRQAPNFFNIVDNVINIIPIDSIHFLSFINKLITSYPPHPVDNGTVVLFDLIW
jgi:hypothetical protein